MDFETKQLIEVSGIHFRNETIELDGNFYTNCRFEGTKLKFRGTGLFGFANCHFEGFNLELLGTARMVLAQLAGLLDDASLLALAHRTLDDTRPPKITN